MDVGGQTTESGPVAAGILEQLLVLGQPDGAPTALQPVVEDTGGDLPPLTRSGAVAQEIALAVVAAVFVERQPDALLGGHKFARDRLSPGMAGIDHRFELR